MGLMDKFKNLFTDEEIIDEEENESIEIKEINTIFSSQNYRQAPNFTRFFLLFS